MTGMLERSTLRRLAVALCVTATVAAGCGGGSTGATTGASPPAGANPRPSSPAVLTIISPRSGEVIHGSTLHVRLGLKNARIVIPTSTHITPTTGHIHLYLDGQIVSMNYQL